MSGWIKLHRSIKDHWLYTEKRAFSKYEAWCDILINVNYADAKQVIKGKVYVIKRGESIYSLDTWGKRWGWDRSKVRRFIKLLESDSMIVLKSDNTTTHLTVCNYETYQDERNAKETQTKRKRNASENQTTTERTSNETQTTTREEEQEFKEEQTNKEEQQEKETGVSVNPFSIEEIFEQCWKAYQGASDRQVGSKQEALKKFKLLEKEDLEKIRVHLPKYIVNHQRTKKTEFFPNFVVYLNQRRFDDEKLPYADKVAEFENNLNNWYKE
jgi:hypothetical protein